MGSYLAAILKLMLLPGLAWGLLLSTPTPPPYLEYLEPYAPHEEPVTLPDDPVLLVDGEPGKQVSVVGIGASPRFEPGKPPGTSVLIEQTFPYPAPGEAPSMGITEESFLLLPDLLTLPPFDLRLTFDRSAGKTFLRFSNAIWNSGIGPLEMRGDLVENDMQVQTSQVIYRNDGEKISLPLGNFYFHEVHNHWHWDGFSLYEIWSVDPDTGALTGLHITSDKVGYCIRDDYRVVGPSHNEGVPPDSPVHLRYRGCTWQKQGLAVGWADTYLVNTPGQYLDITGLPDGHYALVSTANPYQVLHELDRSNNSALTYFALEEGRLEW